MFSISSKSGFDKGGNQAGVGNGGSANSNGDLRVLELGAGGGSGGNAHKLVKNPIGGKGGSGGGGIHLDARYTLEVTGIVSANGEAGQGDTAPRYGTVYKVDEYPLTIVKSVESCICNITICREMSYSFNEQSV